MSEKLSASQYSLYGSGYMPVGSTVGSLPSGTYEVRYSINGPWLAPKDVVTDELVELDDSPSVDIIRELETFWTLGPKFKELGFVHKRGFLLHGPPGTGKSSTINLICSALAKKGGVSVLLSPGVRPDFLTSLLTSIRAAEPQRQVLAIMEDFDNLIESFGEDTVLNLLDGQDSVPGVAFLATTNYLEKLPARIVDRPSRFDRVMRIGPPTPAARRAYLRKFKSLSPDQVEEIVKCSDGISVAHLKEVLISHLCFGLSVSAAADRVRKMAEKISQEEPRGPEPMDLKDDP